MKEAQVEYTGERLPEDILQDTIEQVRMAKVSVRRRDAGYAALKLRKARKSLLKFTAAFSTYYGVPATHLEGFIDEDIEDIDDKLTEMRATLKHCMSVKSKTLSEDFFQDIEQTLEVLRGFADVIEGHQEGIFIIQEGEQQR